METHANCLPKAKQIDEIIITRKGLEETMYQFLVKSALRF